ncbi:hypothetical protein [Paucihalobacter sp.]|uniref:hypothetical protein n=1 Tax=Paucihalobacter sp. TaxID=2850405 RepID=UPI002FE071BD
MARILNNETIFYSFDSNEAYETEEGSIARIKRDNCAYLGNKVDEFKDNDIEGLRLNRAVALIEKSGGRLLKQTKDKGSKRRLLRLLKLVLTHNNEQFLGMRSVYRGLLNARARELLKGFDFNAGSKSADVLADTCIIDTKKSVLLLPNFSAAKLLVQYPKVSKIQVRFLLSRVDFLLGEFFTICSDICTLSSEDETLDLVLDIGKTPDLDGVLMAYLWIGFEREDEAAISKLLWHAEDVFRLLVCEDIRQN